MFRASVTDTRNSWTEKENCEGITLKKTIAKLIAIILMLAGLACAAVFHYSSMLNREIFQKGRPR